MVSNKSKLLSVALMIAAFVGPSFAVQPALAKQDQASDISVSDEQINNKSYQVTRVLIKARPEQVWQVLTDYGSATKVFSTLKKCRVLADCGNAKRIHYQIHPSGVMTCFEYDLDVHETPNKLIEWKKVSGDFKEVEGFWRLEPAEGGRSTHVTYASHVNGGFFVPQALVKRQARMDFPAVMVALKSQAENTTQIAARAPHQSHTAN